MGGRLRGVVERRSGGSAECAWRETLAEAQARSIVSVCP